jgi:hypothetical protein
MVEGFSYEDVTFDDGRGKFPEDLKARAPLGTRQRIKRTAEIEGISAGELIRRALTAYLDRRNENGPLHEACA